MGVLLTATAATLAGQKQFEREVFVERCRQPMCDFGHIAVGDVDGDGLVDLVTSSVTEPIRMYLQQRDGSYREGPSTPQVNSGGGMMTLEDVDDDGDLDLLYSPFRSGSQYVAANDGAGVFGGAGSGRATGYFDFVLARDIDGDGRSDLIGTKGRLRQLYLRRGVLSYVDASARLVSPDQTQVFLDCGDVDADGDLDIVLLTLRMVPQNLLVQVNDGRGFFTQRLFPRVGDYAHRPKLVDVDADGDLDCIVFGQGRPSLMVNTGGGTFVEQPGRMPNVAAAWSQQAGVADFDEDGDLDLQFATGIFHIGQPAWHFVNDGRGNFVDATAARTPVLIGSYRDMVSVDIDGDGDVDSVFLSEIESRLTLLRNHLRQVSGAGSARIGTTYALTVSARRGIATAPQLVAPHLSMRLSAQPLATPFGLWHLDPAGVIWLPVRVVPFPSGTVTAGIAVPSSAFLVGQTAWIQVLVAHGATPVTWRLTNLHRVRIVP